MALHESDMNTDDSFRDSMRHAPWWGQLIGRYGFATAVASGLIMTVVYVLWSLVPRVENIDNNLEKI